MTDRPNLPALTSLRFFAAFYVVLFHGGGGYVSSTIARSFVGTGYVAVDFFFVLSGFVLTYRYCDDHGALLGSPRRFWMARFARIYPVYVASLVIGAPLYLQTLFEHHSLGSTMIKVAIAGIAALLLVQAWVYRIATAWNTPAWSLSVEAVLYALFPWLLPRVVAAIRRRAVWLVGLGVWGLAMVAPVLYLVVKPDGPGPVHVSSDGTWLTVLRFFPLVHVPAFVLGMVAAWCHVRRAPGTTIPGAAVGAVAVLVLAALCAGAWLPYPMLHSGLLAPAFAGLVYCVAGSHGRLVRALSIRPLVALGDASYALYLLHFTLLQYASRLFGGALSLMQFLAFIVVLLVVCLAVYRYFETPSRRALRRRLVSH